MIDNFDWTAKSVYAKLKCAEPQCAPDSSTPKKCWVFQHDYMEHFAAENFRLNCFPMYEKANRVRVEKKQHFPWVYH